MSGPWPTLYTQVVGMAALALGLTVGAYAGWRACAREAERVRDDSEDSGPIVAPVITLAAALPGPPPPGVRIPDWHESAMADALALARDERHAQFHRVFTSEPYEGLAAIVDEIAARAARECPIYR